MHVAFIYSVICTIAMDIDKLCLYQGYRWFLKYCFEISLERLWKGAQFFFSVQTYILMERVLTIGTLIRLSIVWDKLKTNMPTQIVMRRKHAHKGLELIHFKESRWGTQNWSEFKQPDSSDSTQLWTYCINQEINWS